MSSASIMAEIRRKEEILKKKKDEYQAIVDAIAAVDSAWAAVGNTGYENSLNYIKNNSSNYWNILDASGNPCGDVVSFNNSLDEMSQEISSGEVATAMGDVMAKAAEKLAELEAEIAALEAEIAQLWEAYREACAREAAEAAAASEKASLNHERQQASM